MKRQIVVLFILLITQFAKAQSVDTVITTEAYTSYYSFKLKDPLMVVYALYHGGGKCKRAKFTFKTGEIGQRGATNEDYNGNDYDRGHLANAEDFAYDCTLEELTFRYWNCFPQTKKLNRGIWKTMESATRKISQTDSLLILCGGIYDGNTTIGNGVAVPTNCWKVVYSYTQGKVLLSNTFTNVEAPVSSEISINELERMLKNKYGIDLQPFIN